MQANTTIPTSAPAQNADVEIAYQAGVLNSFSIEGGDAQTLDFDGATSVQEFAVPIIPGTLTLPLLHNRTPYVAMSNSQRILYEATKRGFDVVIATILLVLTLPLFVCIGVAIKLTSRGPIFFKHKRLGSHEEEFYCLKFRTMCADAEHRLNGDAELHKRFQESFKIKDDPRITSMGTFLRKTSLDELPQLINVLQGKMSLIGPRPIVKPELSKYSIYGNKLLSVKPGLSGLWQVCGRSDVTYPERVLMDMYYIDHRCLLLDLQLTCFTALAVFRGHGAC
jgi:lipopolysaccharide/colanic/teichoic acid biosynthesis glycosyltransferase